MLSRVRRFFQYLLASNASSRLQATQILVDGLEKDNAALGEKLDQLSHLFAILASQDRSLGALLLDQEVYRRGREPKHILRSPTHMFSQNYEDAIIAEIFARIAPTARGEFVEIGVEDGQECNTRLLLELGWRGVWIDGDEDKLARAANRMRSFIDTGHLRLVPSFVTAENVNEVVSGSANGVAVDFLSIDVDHNTSHVWRSLTSVRPRVACVEYNSSLPPQVDWEARYDPLAVWDETNYFGASLKALERIGRAKEMSLIGCDFHGVNAFFVANDEITGQFLEPFTAEKHFEPPRYPAVIHRGHRAS